MAPGFYRCDSGGPVDRLVLASRVAGAGYGAAESLDLNAE